MSQTRVEVNQVYSDEDTEEIFYTGAWSMDEVHLEPTLAVAGKQGVIKILKGDKSIA